MRKVERSFKGRNISSVEGGHESIERGQGFRLFILGIGQRASEQQASQTQNQGKYPAPTAGRRHGSLFFGHRLSPPQTIMPRPEREGKALTLDALPAAR